MKRISQGWAGSDLESRISAHVQAWQKARPVGRQRRLETYPFVTISREFGCEALPLAQQLVETLNKRCHPSIPWVPYDRELLDKVAEELHLQRDILDRLDEQRRDEMSELFEHIINRKVTDAQIVRKLAELIRTLAIQGHAVLVGRGSSVVTQDLRNGLHIRLVAPREWRVHAVADRRNLSLEEAWRLVAEGEKQRNHYLSTFFVLDPQFPFHYDLVIDKSRFNPSQIVEIVIAALSARFGEALLGA